MTDIIKAEQQPEKLTRQTPSNGKRRQEREKIELKPTESAESQAIAGSTMVEAAQTLADVELVEATRVYAQRSMENFGRFQDFARMIQATGAAAIKQEIEETYGLTESQIYGDRS